MSINIGRALSSTDAVGIVFQLADGTIQSCNTNAEIILDCTAEQLIGASTFNHPWQTIHEDGSVFPPEDHPAIVSMRTGQPCTNVVMGYYRANGELVWLSIDSQPLFKASNTEIYGVEVSFRDITQQIQVFTPEGNSSITLPQTIAQQELTVMLVEDSPEDRELYRRYLQSDRDYQYTFVEADLGDEALAIYQQHQPDVVLLDYLLPDMDGLDWLTQWQQKTKEDRPPVIMLTGQGNETIAIESIKLGATDYLIKGQLTPEKLRLEVKRAIAQHRLHLEYQTALIDLQRNQQFIQQITNAVPGVIYIYDAIAGENIYTNSQSYTLLGYTLQQKAEIGKDFAARIMHPDDLARLPQHIERLKRAKWNEVFSFEYRMRHQNGEWRWFYSQDRVHKRNQDGSVLQILGVAQDISEQQAALQERQQIESELSNQEERLNLATNAAGLGMWFWDLTKDHLEWTDRCKSLFGLKPEVEMTYELFLNTLHPDDRDRTNKAVQQALASKTEYNVKYRTVWSDGSVNWIAAKGRGFYNSEGEPIRMMGVAQDINEQEQNKQALEARESQLKLITEVIPQQVWTALPGGEIDYVNQRWQDYTGATLEQVQNRGWETVVHPEDLEQVNQAWDQALETGKDYNVKARLRRANGKYHWFLARAKPLRNKQGKIIQWYGTNTNISRIKQLEERLKRQTEDLTQANQLKDEFLAIVSHELRTPLNPILGWSQLLMAGRLKPEKTAEGIAIIERNAKLQVQLIEDLLDVSSILRGKLNLKATPLNLELVIRAALTTVQLAAEAKSIQIETSFAPNIGQVSGDAGRLQQVIWNLVANGIKFTPDGGKVTVTLERAGNRALIQVKDTGIGIDPEFLPYVFERFRQAESSSTRKFGGLGLGLAIVRHLSELHGGTVSVVSAGIGQGATFTVKLPLVDTPIIKSADLGINLKEANPLNGIQVLVVDDQVDSLNLLAFVLEQEGANVTAVSSADAAIASFHQSTPDLLISDIGMPNINGYSLIAHIRELTSGKDLPAIALTAYASEGDRQRALECGFTEHIAKPINIADLITTIVQII
ncbi:hybrid sensor histidine kinase/response regulator [Pleurocapsa sp. CCALA 161]|uniref:PAS domain-containing protein n=1 Tax=Pleurocapsa sp. CCALA 161 TaxID=2107688 RepID=UPI000D05CA95|nr:PAS domain-containing protein [Pleurocapsa sp. CCALA 161]PSB08898.1 hybrid sensor histidine kinase/response regulator [Pleurocapsa sp. CCALA 161]